MKLRIFIAEDSQENIDTLKIILEGSQLPVEITSIAQTLENAETILREGTFDLALLDIQFKKGPIFEVLDSLVKAQVSLPDIVFVTAHGSYEYATKAIKFACLDFINKPINPDQLKSVILKCLDKIESKEDQKKQLSLLLEILEGDINVPETVAIILAKNRIQYVNMKDLLYIEADGNTSIFHVGEEKYHSVRHLGYYIEIFEGNQAIVQISRSCIINKTQLKRYTSATREILLSNGFKLFASHRASKNLKQRFSMSTNPIKRGIERLKKLL